MSQLYDRIGVGYGARRIPDPRIAEAIQAALGDARSIANVGAGTGSYEPRDRTVVAIEPSQVMIGQRPATAAPVVCASASAIPLRDASFDAALAVLTIHHWPDRMHGLNELRRIARKRVVILTHEHQGGFWLTEYFPDIRRIDSDEFPSDGELEQALGPVTIRPMPIPHDCVDGFLGAYWRRPHAYLDPGVRSAISVFAKLSPIEIDAGLSRLRSDLDSGRWHESQRALLECNTLDVGYRVVTAELEG